MNVKAIIGRDGSLQKIFQLVQRVARTNSTVLVTGESGTGKELIVRELHRTSQRAKGPFVPVNCGAIPHELLESELFGHEKGAFTGALHTRQGRFELANGGTIFLDEIGEMDISLQVKILRVLQEKEIERVGGQKAIPVDVRIVAATNRDLEQETIAGRFREDLYYRLNVIPIQLPPLRERRGDILTLAQYFLQKFCQEQERPELQIPPEVASLLTQYTWPGNVRELENVMERMSILAEQESLTPQDLPAKICNAPQSSQEDLAWPRLSSLSRFGGTLKEFLQAIELSLIREALQNCAGSQTEAAKVLGIKRTTLVEKLHRVP